MARKSEVENQRPKVASPTHQAQVTLAVETVASLFEERELLKAQLEDADKRFKVALAELEVEFDLKAQPADQPVVVVGREHSVHFSVVANIKHWHEDAVKKLRNLLGAENFFKIAKVTFTDAEKYIPGNDLAKLYTERRDGVRRVTVKKLEE